MPQLGMESFVSSSLLGNAGSEISLFLWRAGWHGWGGFWFWFGFGLPLRWFCAAPFPGKVGFETNFMSLLEGNLLVAQSGGPTAVINASAAGVIEQAGKHVQISEIYAGRNGILGILEEDLFDLNEEMARSVEALKHTPGAAFGTCRYKINFAKAPEQAAKDMDRLFEVFRAHDIRFFFYIGGNDSQDTSNKIHEEALRRGHEMRVIGIPKTIDNDLPHTDHCPGYGSAIKYNAAAVMEVGADVGSMATDGGACCVLEVMGRSAGWIAAGTILAKRDPNDPPHIILLPEILFREDAFLDRVRQVVTANRYCIVVVGEGLKNEAGEEIAADKNRLDAFGHPVLSGAADRLADIIQGRIQLKTRTVKFGYAQRSAAHYASAIDVKEAVACGREAVRAAVEDNLSGYMVKILRTGESPYIWETGLHPLAEIANVERLLPRDWIEEDGFLPNQKFVDYARPLIQGLNEAPTEGGLPKFVRLTKLPVEKKLPARSTAFPKPSLAGAKLPAFAAAEPEKHPHGKDIPVHLLRARPEHADDSGESKE